MLTVVSSAASKPSLISAKPTTHSASRTFRWCSSVDPTWCRSGPEATVETEVDGHVVGLRQGNILATAFHPELTDDVRIHELFLSL